MSTEIDKDNGKDRLRTVYIASLLVLATLLVLFVQGTFIGLYEESGKPMIEIIRIDLYNDFVGNYSKVSVTITNNDSISHDFTVSTFYDDELEDSFNTTVKSGKVFTYQTDVLPDKIPITSSETIDSTLKVAKFMVYLDEQSEPFEQTSFVFKN